MAKLVVDELELKAAVYDYIMSHITDKDFESVAAVAGDVARIVVDIAKVYKDDFEAMAKRIENGQPIKINK